MRGRRLVTTERIVAIVAEGGKAVLEDVEAWANDNGLYLDSIPVGEPIESVVDDTASTIGLTIGGDGTFLEGVKEFSPREIPLLGIDAGTNTFLVRVSPDDVETALSEIIRGHATIESRSQLQVRAGDLDGTGLNDVVIEHIEPVKPVDRKITNLEVFVGDEYVGMYRGDGLTVSTPTGSTGLALSAGGPVHYPVKNHTLQITPLLTHHIGVRPVIVDEGVPITIEPQGPVVVSVDGGRHHRTFDPAVPIRIELADETAELIHTSAEGEFFEGLSTILGWNIRGETKPEVPSHVVASDTADSILERAQAIAEEAAQSVGGPLRELHGRTESIEYKSDKADVVTEADYQSERIITRVLESEFPGHNIHSEEDVHHDTGSRYTWLIDPLDGSGNYANGNPNYAVSIALVREDEPVVGVVYAPETDELFSATKGGNAYRDGKRISTTDRDQLNESVFMSGYDPDGRFLSHFYNVTRGVRRLGSVSLHLCYLASGSCDATWEYDTYPWDTAAGVVIATEAGATLTDASGESYTIYGGKRERNELLGSNGPLHQSILAHLKTHELLGE